VTFCGDGATNVGTFHESLNLAATWRLPAVFVVENNHYGGYSPLTATTPIERLADRAVSYGIPSVWVDGNDVLAVRDVADEAVERARSGAGPMLIEADTFLQRGHLGTELADSRPEGELEFWTARDPINRLARTVVGAGRASVDQLAAIRERTAEEVDVALRAALSWPEPDPKERFDSVWA
jgi:pyruvate dehydrogenase E1 component alpha subunit